MKIRRTNRRATGFTLIEVMVALVVISVGLLGIAKMQALALSSTSTSRLRSLAAIEGASLASAMHANRAYWAAATLTEPISVTGAAATTSDANLTSALVTVSGATSPADYCTPGAGAPCKPVTLAATDLRGWATDLNMVLPKSSATITCSPTFTPLTCTIQIRWSENLVAVNKQGNTAAGTTDSFTDPTYILYVEP